MVLILLTFGLLSIASYCTAYDKIVCYYDSRSHFRQGLAKFDVPDIEPALQYCTHLIYGYAAISDDFKLIPLNEQFDIIKDHYRRITDLRQRHPKLKVLLSVGGGADVSGEGVELNLKYRTLLESHQTRLAFVNSAYTIVKGYGFDGLDLGWEFPENKPKKIRSTLGGFWHSVKKTFKTTVIDENAADHREQFVSLVRELKGAFRAENLLVTLTVLPNVNSTVYYDPRLLAPNLDFVNLMAFDFYTPARNPKEADYPAPLYELVDRKPDENVDAQVQYWLSNGAPGHKLIVGIPTWGQAWTMTTDSDINGIPPLTVDGEAPAGTVTKTAGKLSYPEICELLNNPQNKKLSSALQVKTIKDPSKRKGSYAFKLPDENNNGGFWVGFDDEEVVRYKADYVKAKHLGGIAIDDLDDDDYRGTCGREKYDLLRVVASQL